MISHYSRCIFVHPRRCAGTAIQQAFDFTQDDPDWKAFNDGSLDPEFAHRPADYLVFAIVRNPWDRFVSGWQSCERTRQRSLRDALLDAPLEDPDHGPLLRPQHEILFHPDGRAVFDVLLRYESLQDDFEKLCVRLGKPLQVLPRGDSGAHAPYRECFDDSTRELLAQRYARDIELFSYAF